METLKDDLQGGLGQYETSHSDDRMGSSSLVENQEQDVAIDDGYTPGERRPGFSLSAPTQAGDPGEDEPKKGWRSFFAKKEKAPRVEVAPPTREKRPKVIKQGRRVSAADTIGDAWAGLGALAVRSGRHVPLGRYMAYSSGVTGEILDDAIKGTPLDRMILQPVAKGRGRFDALGAVFGPPLIILAIERDPAKAEMLMPVLRSSIRSSLPLMAPAIKRIQKKEAEAEAAAIELGFDPANGDPADQIISMIFGDWVPPAPPEPEQPIEEDETTHATQVA